LNIEKSKGGQKNMLGLFESKCPVCGMKTDENSVERNGKKFCSEEHASQHEAEEKELSKKMKGCCGLKLDK
jgi:YHS domain-containing protein